MVVKVRERLVGSKQAVQKFDGKRFNLRKLIKSWRLGNSIKQTGLQLWRT